MKDSIFETQLADFLQQNCGPNLMAERLLRFPSCLHVMLCSAYLDNWRWWLRDLGELVSRSVRGDGSRRRYAENKGL